MNGNGGSPPGTHDNNHHDNHRHHHLVTQIQHDQLDHEHIHAFHNNVNFHSPGQPIQKSKTPGKSAKKLDQQPLTLSSPSPAHKMPGSHMRNELYLKSVLSSPYQHKSYTPMSATPCGLSPAFKTPIRSALNSPSNLCSTPQDAKPPIPGGHATPQTPQDTRPLFPVNATPQNRRIPNPFDHGLLDDLHGPMFMSPGVFSLGSTPASDEKKPFRWSIEHIAVLNPADIEEMPVHQDAHLLPDKEAEERAQLAIDKFFSNHLIAPSPWSADSKKLPKTPASVTGNAGRLPNMNLEEELQGSIQKQLPKKSSTQEVGCQTALSLPADFDIAKVLGAYMNQSVSEDVNTDVLSTSSLRRKLFFQGDTSSVAPSPVRGGHLDDSLSADILAASPQVSPVNQQLQPWEQATPLKTPTRNQFSSSPIKNVKGLKTPQFHTPPGGEFFNSPELSPIVRGHLRRSRSSGLFVPHDGSFFSEDGGGGGETKPTGKPLISPEVSPIKGEFVMKTPSSEERSKHSLQDPGISPIHAHSVHKHSDDEGSFIQGHEGFTSSDDSDYDMTTPMPAFHTEKRRPGSTRKISHLTRHRQRNILPEMEDTAMEFESVPIDKNLRFAENIKTSSLLITRDISYVDMECTSENMAAPNSTNQDTGYHTASLQSTNQDTGLHTNLTTQFNSLPFNTTNLDLIYNNAPLASTSQDIMSNSANQMGSVPVTAESVFQSDLNDSAISHEEFIPEEEREEKLVQQILEISRTEKCGNHGDTMSEEEILQRARQVLAMANSLYPDIKSEHNTGSKVKPRLINQRRLSILNELEPIVSSTPHKSAKDPFKNVNLPTAVKSPSPSEKALAIIRKAGEDLARYSHVLDTVKS